MPGFETVLQSLRRGESSLMEPSAVKRRQRKDEAGVIQAITTKECAQTVSKAPALMAMP